MKKYHEINSISFINDELILIVDGKKYTFLLVNVSLKLFKATKIEREKYQISASGYGIYWPLLDEDLSIDGLLGITHNRLKAG